MNTSIEVARILLESNAIRHKDIPLGRQATTHPELFRDLVEKIEKFFNNKEQLIFLSQTKKNRFLAELVGTTQLFEEVARILITYHS